MTETQLEMTRGDNVSFDIVVKDSAGALINITGASFWFTVKAAVGDADPGLFQRTSAGGHIVITNGAAGQARIDLTSANTSGFTDSRVLYWDLQMLLAAKYQTVARGRLLVVADVTLAV